MEPIKKEKRPVAAYVPYRKKGDEYEFYLQMRDSNARTHPNMFAIFGGGIEQGESSQEALMREVMEELTYVPTNYRYFSRYESANGVFDLYFEEIFNDFESSVTVCEGEYGKFLSYEEVQHLPNVSNLTRQVVENLNAFLLSQ